jgi:hypothetical protein
MLHDILADYVKKIDDSLQRLQKVYVEAYETEILNPERVNIRIRLRYSSGFLLELNEAVYINSRQLAFLGYRYHFQDEKNNLIFRYDNTPHFPDLESFPDHKHTEAAVISSQKPSIIEVIYEATET